MNHVKMSGMFQVLSLLLIAVLLGTGTSTPAAAQGLKEKLTLRRHKDKNNDKIPNVGISSPQEADGSPSSPTARRNVLFVTEPKNGADVPAGATIAFIQFDHIERQVPNYLQFRRTTETTNEHFNGTDTRTTVEHDVYNSDICARQVASALAQHLADLNLYKVVSRDHIESIIDEQNFANSGSVDSTTAARLGKLIGADILIYGQVQLCVSSRMDYGAIAGALQSVGPNGKIGNLLGNIAGAVQSFKPEKMRSFVLAQIQLIEAQTGKHIFTTSLVGEFIDSTNALDFDMKHRELIYRAVDDLANTFIDNFLSRPEPRYIGLYSDSTWNFGTGINLIQLGNCSRAEQYFRNVYTRNQGMMNELDLARLMYNHGIALMCSNRPKEALDKLWSSLRLSNDKTTFDAIAFTNDTIDRGRHIKAENDPIIRDVEEKMYPASGSPTRPAAESTATGAL